MSEVLCPESLRELEEAVRSSSSIRVRCGGSKPGLSQAAADESIVSTERIRGVVAYDADEYTISVRCGTPVSEVEATLQEQGQSLPFDPLFGGAGASIGGTVAAACHGPGRYRHGGVRDFLLAVRFVDGLGQSVRAGAPVVKNAAGFDVPKLLVGSLGTLGILVDCTFKVFPAPKALQTICASVGSFDDAVSVVRGLRDLPLELECIEPSRLDGRWSVDVRVGGLEASVPARVGRIVEQIEARGASCEILEGREELDFWRARRELDWSSGGALVRMPTSPHRAPVVEGLLADAGLASCPRVYSGGLQDGWIGVHDTSSEDDPYEEKLARLSRALEDVGRSALTVRVAGAEQRPPASAHSPILGRGIAKDPFAVAVRRALDPDQRFARWSAPAWRTYTE